MKFNLGMYVEKYAWGLNVLLLVLLAYLGAKMTNTMVRSSYIVPASIDVWGPPAGEFIETQTRLKTDLVRIEDRNIFGAKIRDQEAASMAMENEEIVATSLNFKLLGIITGPKWRLATIENKDKREKMVLGEGEMVAPGVFISAIESDRVILSRNNRPEELILDYHSRSPGARGPRSRKPTPARPSPMQPNLGGSGVRALSETEYVIDREEFDAQLSNINNLVTQARVVPNFTPDRQVDGFRMFQIHPGSIYQKLGLRNGDVIQFVNGIKMDDPTKGLALFQALKNQSSFTIDLKRRNQKMTFSYDVR